MRQLEREVLLQVIDRKWREHLYEMDYLQEGIGLRAHAQRDPLVEYQREGFNMFSQMLEGIKEEAVGFLYNLEVQVEVQEAPAPVIDVSRGPAAAVAEAGRDPGEGARASPASHAPCSIRRRRSMATPAMVGPSSSRLRRSAWASAAARPERRGPPDRRGRAARSLR